MISFIFSICKVVHFGHVLSTKRKKSIIIIRAWQLITHFRRAADTSHKRRDSIQPRKSEAPFCVSNQSSKFHHWSTIWCRIKFGMWTDISPALGGAHNLQNSFPESDPYTIGTNSNGGIGNNTKNNRTNQEQFQFHTPRKERRHPAWGLAQERTRESKRRYLLYRECYSTTIFGNFGYHHQKNDTFGSTRRPKKTSRTNVLCHKSAIESTRLIASYDTRRQ